MMQHVRDDITDEIALEGLDGITLQGLWERLRTRPDFLNEVELDRPLQVFYWKIVSKLSTIEFFELPEPRSDLVIFDRYKFVDPESGTILEQDQKEDIYPFCPVECPQTFTRGSCSTFYSRVNITAQTRSLSLEDAEKKYGKKLVLVANQDSRRKSLRISHLNPITVLTVHSYAILERIGRARYLGELTNGKNSLCVDIKLIDHGGKKSYASRGERVDAKSQFYLRKQLLKLELIVKQTHRQKSLRGCYNVASLLQLKRFYVERKSKFMLWIESTVKLLKESRNNMCLTSDVRQNLDAPPKSVKRLFKSPEFAKYIISEDVPYRTLHPDATENQYFHKSKNQEKIIKILRLKNPQMDLSELDGDSDDESNQKDEDDQEDGKTSVNEKLQERFVSPLEYYDGAYSLASACFPEFIAAGPNGLSQTEAGKLLGSTKLDTRSLCRSFERKGCLKSVMHDSGKQRVARYIAFPFDKTGSLTRDFQDEKKKLIAFKNMEVTEEIDVTPANADADTSSTVEPVQNDTQERLPEMEPQTQTLAVAEPLSQGSNPLSSYKHMKHETTRLLKRKNIILEIIKRDRVVEDRMFLQRAICQAEEMEGYTSRMDRKSLCRILARLENDGFIRMVTHKIEEPVPSSCSMIVDASIPDSHPIVKATIEQRRHKLLVKSMSNHPADKSPQKNSAKHPPVVKTSVDESLEQLRQMQDKVRPNTGIIKPNLLVKSWVGSKFVRLKYLHYLLFYLVYEYEGDDKMDQKEIWEKIRQKISSPESFEGFPQVYHKEISWKMFVPPLPAHNTMNKEGWAFVVDILLRLPLSLFVCLVNVAVYDDALHPFLNHPIKKYLLVKDLPSEIRTCLLQGRRYVSSITELTNKLCCMGLIQYGPQGLKEKDQAFIYVNRRALVVDTTTSEPNYHRVSDKHYTRTLHCLSSLCELGQYWIALETVCLDTPLGIHTYARGRSIVMSSLEKHPCLLPQTAETASARDVGYIPGDCSGAGGLDSSLFSHLPRNWLLMSRYQVQDSLNIYSSRDTIKDSSFTITKQTLPGTIKTIEVRKIPNPKLSSHQKRPLPVDPEKPDNLDSMEPPMKIRRITSPIPLPIKQKQKTRLKFVKERKKQVRKPYYDETDRAALRLMRKLRVDWSASEDLILILCRVASMIILPLRVGQISFGLVRDYLHSKLELSRNKTSRACQRRVNFMLKDSANRQKFNVYLQEAKTDENIMKDVQTFTTTSKNDCVNSDLHRAFVSLVDKLSEKFACKVPRRRIIHLPNSMEEFHKNFEFMSSSVKSHRSLSSLVLPPCVLGKDDVDFYTVYTLLFSCFCSLHDKESWGCQLYMVFQKYSKPLLQTVLAAVRKSKMTSFKKHCKKTQFPKQVLPLTSSPYQLSQSFINLFTQKYQQDLYYMTFNMMKQMVFNKKKHIQSHLSVSEQIGKRRKKYYRRKGYRRRRLSKADQKEFKEESIAHILENFDEPKLQVSSNPDGGVCATIVSLFAMRSIKMEHIIPDSIVEPVVDEEGDNSNESILRRIRDHEQVSERELFVPEDFPLDGDEDENIFGGQESQDEDEESGEPGSSLSPNKICSKPTRSRMSVFRHREYLLGHSDTPKFSAACQEKMKVKISELSISLRLPPGQNLLRRTKFRDLDSLFLPVPKDLLQECLKKCQKVIFEDKIPLKEGSKLQKYSVPILEFIEESEEVGVTSRMLKDRFGGMFGRPILEYIRELENLNQVLSVGVATRRWILPSFSERWLINTRKVPSHEAQKRKALQVPGVYNLQNVEGKQAEDCPEPTSESSEDDQPMEIDDRSWEHSEDETEIPLGSYTEHPSTSDALVTRGRLSLCNKNHRATAGANEDLDQETILSANLCEYDEINIKVRPWVRLNGCINRRVMDQFLGSILFFIYEHPGVRTPDIGLRFYPGLLPAHTYELLDILVKLKCVRRSYTGTKSTRIPFQKEGPSCIVDTEDYDFDDELIHDTTPDALLKLSVFIGDRTYKGNFLSICR